MRVTLYVEGGGDSKSTKTSLREGFRNLLLNCGFEDRLPRVIACGSRKNAYDDYSHALAEVKRGEFVAMLVDSEDPVDDIKKPWDHLIKRKDDKWDKPAMATNEQALLMVTCMETWIVTARKSLESYYGTELQISALPPLDNMESRHRKDVQKALEKATNGLKNSYEKGKRSFEVLAILDPAELRNLPSFVRCETILKKKLKVP